MDDYKVSSQSELNIYWAMLALNATFMPVAVNLAFKVHIKAVLFASCASIVAASTSFIFCHKFITFVSLVCIFNAFATASIQLVSFLLAWEWFAPGKRGVLTAMVVSLESCTTALVIALQT